MRRTKVTQIYKKTGNLRAAQLLLGQTKMDSTIRYLGVELEDVLAISEAIEVYAAWAAVAGGPFRTFTKLVSPQCRINNADIALYQISIAH